MGPAAALLALWCVPAGAGAPPPGAARPPTGAASYVERRDALVAQYLAEARGRLARARGFLEAVQELMLTPHSADGPAEAALLHLDLAEAALSAAEPTLARLPPAAAPPGWTPFEDRLARARELLRAAAPDLEAVYARVPAAAGPLERNDVGMFDGSAPRVVLRGYHALGTVTPEYLATILAHEAAHVLQWEAAHARGEKFRAGVPEEAEARRREAAVWAALGAPREKDFDGAAAAVAKAVAGGAQELELHVARESDAARDWEWVTPPAAAAPPPAVPPWPPTDAAAPAEPASDASALDVDSLIGGIRADFAKAALARLDAARAVLGTTVELAAPFPKIVNFELVQVWALRPKRYPPAIHQAFQALHPALTELDKARAALAAPHVCEEDRTLLARYAGDRATARAWDPADAARALKALPRAARKGAALASVPVGDAPQAEPARVVVPGAWVDRSTNTDVAAAWAAHVLAHRGLAGAAPTLEEEVAAVQAALKVWAEIGADARFDKAHPDRFLRYRVLEQGGGREALRVYLKASGFE